MDRPTSGGDDVLSVGSDSDRTHNKEPWITRQAALILITIASLLSGSLAYVGTRTVVQVPQNQAVIARQQQLIVEVQALTKRLCEEENAQDAEQVALWEFIISLGENTPRTPQEQADRQRTLPLFREYITKTFVPKDCTTKES